MVLLFWFCFCCCLPKNTPTKKHINNQNPCFIVLLPFVPSRVLTREKKKKKQQPPPPKKKNPPLFFFVVFIYFCLFSFILFLSPFLLIIYLVCFCFPSLLQSKNKTKGGKKTQEQEEDKQKNENKKGTPPPKKKYKNLVVHMVNLRYFCLV